MKRPLFLLAILSLFLTKEGPAQSCLPEGIEFLSQAEIDSFSINFPGCTEIEGGVTIQGEEIMNLDGLLGLASIGGDLLIGQQWFEDYYTNNELLSLKGLDSLHSIGGDLRIIYNLSLGALNGLEKLSSIDGNLSIGANPLLESLNGLKSLTSIGGDISISNNFALINIKELGEGSLSTLDGDLFIIGNHALNSLVGLDSIHSIHGHLWISGNPMLTSLSGLEGILTLDGDLVIYLNDGLISLHGLESLPHIGGRLLIHENESLTTLNGLGSLSSVGWVLGIRDNESLISLSALEGLTSIAGSLEISGNTVLPSLDGLDNLNYSTIDFLSIFSCPSLSDCATPTICNYLIYGEDAEIYGNGSGCSTFNEALNACKEVSVEDISEEENSVQIFPNPSSGIYHILGNTNSNWGFLVKDLMGNVVKKQDNLLAGQFDLSAFPNGMYILVLNDKEQLIVKRILKN